MHKLAIFNICIWLMILGREVLRGFLAYRGLLEWRGWYFNTSINFWPSYVTMWDMMFIPISLYYIQSSWSRLEWKSNGE